MLIVKCGGYNGVLHLHLQSSPSCSWLVRFSRVLVAGLVACAVVFWSGLRGTGWIKGRPFLYGLRPNLVQG